MADCLVVLQQAIISISSGQQNLIKTYHNEGDTGEMIFNKNCVQNENFFWEIQIIFDVKKWP